MASTVCRACAAASPHELINFGSQPVSNHYLVDPRALEKLFPRVVGQCHQCGLIQMAWTLSAAEICPPYSWIRYDEAEGHLDDMVGQIFQTTGLKTESTVYGLSYKDTSTLERFRIRNSCQTVSVNIATDLGESSPCAGVETVQELFDAEHAQALAGSHGYADLIVARHILEHVSDMTRFAHAVKILLKPEGYLVVEVPDFSTALECTDYCTLWEEHTVFFTPATLITTLNHLGFEVVKTLSYPYPLENALVAIVRPSQSSWAVTDVGVLAADLEKGDIYAETFPLLRDRMQDYLTAFRKRQGPVAVFGAGHLACDFINLLDLKEQIAFIADDHPHKRGLFMPGSHLPVLSSSNLVEQNIRLSLLTIKPESEQRVVQANAKFQNLGGRFASIFPRHPWSLRNELGI